MENIVKQVEERLSWFAGGYACGLVGEANIAWLQDQDYADLFVVGDMYRVGLCAWLSGKVEDDPSPEHTQKLERFLEDTDGLEDYPLMDDDYYNEAQLRAEEKWVEWFAQSYRVEPSAVWEYMSQNDVCFQTEYDAVYPDWSDDDEAVVGIKRLSQTWDAHYKSGLFHEPEVCSYCIEAEEK